MKQITNLTTRPVVLGDGTILAAAKTKGSVKQVETLGDLDARRLAGSIHVSDVEPNPNPVADKDVARTTRNAGDSVEEEKK